MPGPNYEAQAINDCAHMILNRLSCGPASEKTLREMWRKNATTPAYGLPADSIPEVFRRALGILEDGKRISKTRRYYLVQ
jgi:hypothetical protein